MTSAPLTTLLRLDHLGADVLQSRHVVAQTLSSRLRRVQVELKVDVRVFGGGRRHAEIQRQLQYEMGFKYMYMYKILLERTLRRLTDLRSAA